MSLICAVVYRNKTFNTSLNLHLYLFKARLKFDKMCFIVPFFPDTFRRNRFMTDGSTSYDDRISLSYTVHPVPIHCSTKVNPNTKISAEGNTQKLKLFNLENAYLGLQCKIVQINYKNGLWKNQKKYHYKSTSS